MGEGGVVLPTPEGRSEKRKKRHPSMTVDMMMIMSSYN